IAPRSASARFVCRLSMSTTRGSACGISTTVVIPPATADAVPCAKSSRSIFDGSRRWVWMSTPPGKTCRPVASRRSPASADESSTRPLIRPSRMTMSARNAPCSPTIVPPETISTELIAVASAGGAPAGAGAPSTTTDACSLFRPATLPGDPERPVSRVLQEEVVDVVAVGEAVRRIDQPHEWRLGHDDLLPLLEELAALGDVDRRLRAAVERVGGGVLPAGVRGVRAAVGDAAVEHVRVRVEIVARPIVPGHLELLLRLAFDRRRRVEWLQGHVDADLLELVLHDDGNRVTDGVARDGRKGDLEALRVLG